MGPESGHSWETEQGDGAGMRSVAGGRGPSRWGAHICTDVPCGMDVQGFLPGGDLLFSFGYIENCFVE